METLSSLFNTSIEIPYLIAGLIYRFFQFLIRPYNAVLMTRRLLKSFKISTIFPLIIAFLLFALSLGFPDTRDLILTFNGGMSSSLKHVTKIDAKGKEFPYLSMFVIGATAFSVFVGLVLRDLLRLKRGLKKHFLDTLNVFTAFTIGWFIVLAIFISIFFGRLTSPTRFESLSNEINLSFIFRQLGMADVSDVLISPALALTLILSVYFGYHILNRWARKRGFIDIV